MKITKVGGQEKTTYRVAAYCRVSTDKADQQESLETQRRYYTELINSNTSWKMAGIYADERSGTSAAHRPQFMRMIEDARAGYIDIVLVKSISRFGRNVSECQQYARELKVLGVEVRFEKEGISNMDPSADFLFSVLSITAQEESHSISENMHWAYTKNFERGIYHMGNNRILGYDMGEDGKLVPNDDAWIIRRAFKDYADGMNLEQTAEDLNRAGAHRLRSDRPFDGNSVRRMLHNETYVGDLHLQKNPPVDYLTKKPMMNMEYTTYMVRDDHEGIIDRELWDTVKEELDKVENALSDGVYKSKTRTHFLYGIVYCAECGSPMVRRTYVGGKKEKYKAWNCRGRQHGNGCKNPAIRESELIEEILDSLKEHGIPTDGDIEAVITENVRRVDVGPEEVRITFKDEVEKAG